MRPLIGTKHKKITYNEYEIILCNNVNKFMAAGNRVYKTVKHFWKIFFKLHFIIHFIDICVKFEKFKNY